MASNEGVMGRRKLKETERAAEGIKNLIQKTIDDGPGNTGGDNRKGVKGELHGGVGLQREMCIVGRLQAVRRKDTTTLWRLITASAEAAFIKTLAIDGAAAKAMQGRGTVTIREQTLQPEDKRQTGSMDTDSRALQRRAGKHSEQMQQVSHAPADPARVGVE